MSYRQKLTRLQQSRAKVVTPSARRSVAKAKPAKIAPSPKKRAKAKTQRHVVGNADFDKMGKRWQKMIRRIAVNDDHTALDLMRGWQLVSDTSSRRCNIKAHDAIDISVFKSQRSHAYAQMLSDVRRHFAGSES